MKTLNDLHGTWPGDETDAELADAMREQLPILPDRDDNGVPFCQEECPHHDGKRCRIMGFRPGSICEPAVLEIIDALARAEEEKGRLLRHDTPWPLVDVVTKLVGATDILLNQYDYDALGWELFSYAAAEARNWLSERERDAEAARAALESKGPEHE